jgi:MFS transporter, DHA1 family, tetracycline resistance protein
MNRRLLVSIFLVVFVDLLGFSLILPLLPYYADSLGANSVVVGLIVSSYAAAQLVGAPLLGRLSDRFGRRPILLLSIFGTFLGFVLLAVGGSLWVLFASRVLDGLTGGNITVAQAYIADSTDSRNRSQGFGLIGAAFGLGFILGPAAGGYLSQWGYGVPAIAAAGLSLFNLALVTFWLPESLSEERRLAYAQSTARPAVTLRALLAALRRPQVGPLLHTRFFFGLAFAMMQTVFGLYALRRFALGAQGTGLILAYVGVLAAIVQGVLVGRLSRRFGEMRLIVFSVAVMSVSLGAWALVASIPALLVVLAPIAVSGGVLNTVINSAITQTVAVDEVGGALGLAGALESATRVIAPTLAGFLLGTLGTWAPGAFGALLLAWLLTFIVRKGMLPLPARARAKSLASGG